MNEKDLLKLLLEAEGNEIEADENGEVTEETGGETAENTNADEASEQDNQEEDNVLTLVDQQELFIDTFIERMNLEGAIKLSKDNTTTKTKIITMRADPDNVNYDPNKKILSFDVEFLKGKTAETLGSRVTKAVGNVINTLAGGYKSHSGGVAHF